MKSSRPARPRAAFAAALAALLLIVPGCSAIPRSGPVATIPAPAAEEDTVSQVFSPEGPQPDASPEVLLQEFITAGTGAADGYKVARQFLTPELAKTWQPEERIVIFRADPRIIQREAEGALQVQLEITGIIDSQGIRTDPPNPTTESVRAEMVKINGQWRISEIPNGIMVTESNASLLATAHHLYFYSSGYRYWVPDVRWFVRRPGIAARVVQALLAGPAPYLQGAVTSAFPEGVTLAQESVPITSGVASVELSEEVLQDATDLRLQQMEQQLRVNLTTLNDVTSVEMSAGQPIDLGSPDPALIIPDFNPPVGNEQVVIANNEVRIVRDLSVLPVEGLPSAAGYDPKDPARSLEGSNFAFLNGRATALLATAPGSEVRTAVEGAGLTAPSFDPSNWLWTTRSVPGGPSGRGTEVVAVPPGGMTRNAVVVAASWLADRTVTEFQVSRDGARALLVVDEAGVSEVLLAGITRSAQGIPQSLGNPIALNAGENIGTAKWAGESTVVASPVSETAEVTPLIVELSGETETLKAQKGVLNISAGSDPQEDFYIQTAEALFARVGSSWIRSIEGVRDPAFPG
ncbi:LpqB family beta-propeller domain-containing protein [Arthrobacter sp. TMN-37]